MTKSNKKEKSVPLTEQWLLWKHAENEAKERRLAVEVLILEERKDQIKAEGTSHIDDVLTITSGYQRKWDQDFLRKQYEERGNKPFPFKMEFSEVRADAKYVEANEPEIWKQYVEGLTVSPQKPSFKAKA